ncbi:hypothetical protein D9615_007300 [Tricholomella constricta]|uniref:Protein kinase domain-containing protein n=1 Tax=Tricholomella constricta TaxID=117010 RepID=A0A8H5H5B7_9AGAR|nr:hypothetical protein D9615_007300 [Tricholomella constricta]
MRYRYPDYCKAHALAGESPLPLIGEVPYRGNAYVDIYHGKVGQLPIQLKVWRGAPMAVEARADFLLQLMRGLDDWKRASVHQNVSLFLGLSDKPEWQPLPSLVTPLYSNGNIVQYIKQNPGISVLSLLHNVADALQFMHSLDPPVVHGGVRGNNIVIADNGEARLTDLCINFLPHPQDFAMVRDELEPARWYAPEVIVPPKELANECNVTTPESDVYSFGMTMLEVYGGKKPYADMRHYSYIHAASQGIRPPRPDTEALTDSVWALITACWAQESRHRPQMKTIRGSIHALYLQSFANSSTGHI